MLSGLRAWITAIRREQTPARAGARVVERDRKFEVIKINPLAAWSRQRCVALYQASTMFPTTRFMTWAIAPSVVNRVRRLSKSAKKNEPGVGAAPQRQNVDYMSS